MLAGVDFSSFRFGEPTYLWLLVGPGLLLAFWLSRVVRRRADLRRYRRNRVLAIPERHSLFGDLAFWLCLIVAASLCIVALARPQARISLVRQAGADIVLLLDGSASMYVRDVMPDRWQRSVRFLRAFAEALSWKGDRVALALFAHIAAPQTRLTKDPNAFFFFLDHLGKQSPFRLEDIPTWDTNIEEGVYWGLRLVEVDEQLFGKTNNPKAFVVVSDGQAWSGNVATALQTARDRGIPVHVLGIGTTAGGLIPEPPAADGTAQASAILSVLDRDALREIAHAGGGEYFEIGREGDRALAFKIIERVRRRATVVQEQESYEELYWRALFAAAVFLCLGTVALKQPTELWLQVAGALAALVLVATAIG